MPYLKFIKGHTSPTYVQDYLEKSGRALEKDFVNVCEWPSSTWGQEMDAFRATYAKRTGNRTGELTYLHYVLSPDPSDNVTLEELQEFTMEFLERAFEDKFQIAVVYHDDSAMRLANGEKGILHAHFVVNSLNLDDGYRITRWLNKPKIREINQLCQQMAKERGWHNFLDQDAEDANQSKDDRKGRLAHDEEREDFEGMALDERCKDDKTPYITRRTGFYTRTELDIMEKGLWSWKEDLRCRVRIARELSATEAEFIEALGLLDVSVETTAKGDYRYRHPEDAAYVSNGYRLGAAYSRRGVRSALDANAQTVSRPRPKTMERARALAALQAWRVTGDRTIGWAEPNEGLELSDVASAMEVARSCRIEKASDWAHAIAEAPSSADREAAIKARDTMAALDRIADSPWASSGVERRLSQMAPEEAAKLVHERYEQIAQDAPRPKRKAASKKPATQREAERQTHERNRRSNEGRKSHEGKRRS